MGRLPTATNYKEERTMRQHPCFPFFYTSFQSSPNWDLGDDQNNEFAASSSLNAAFWHKTLLDTFF